MLSKGDSGWVLYDDEGRVTVLGGESDAMLEAATVMRENGDPVAGWWGAILDAEVPTYRFTPKESGGEAGWWSAVLDAEGPDIPDYTEHR